MIKRRVRVRTGKNPPKLERCVKAVQKKGGAKNAYAVCTAAMKKKNGRKNHGSTAEYEAAGAASKEFHGTPPHEDIEVMYEHFEHDHLADCGELIRLEIIAKNGDRVDVEGFEGARLGRSPKGSKDQLYIEGGDQSVNLEDFGIEKPHELEYLGDLKYVTYYTTKHHLGRDGGEADYRHKFNDGANYRIETIKKNRPKVIYDVLNQRLALAGGEYEILPEGIDN